MNQSINGNPIGGSPSNKPLETQLVFMYRDFRKKNKKKQAVVHDGYFPPIPHIGDHTIVFNIRGVGIHLPAIKTLRQVSALVITSTSHPSDTMVLGHPGFL